jgi:hypothetical protein
MNAEMFGFNNSESPFDFALISNPLEGELYNPLAMRSQQLPIQTEEINLPMADQLT